MVINFTHVFKREHDCCDDSGHKDDDSQDAEKTSTFGEIHLMGKSGVNQQRQQQGSPNKYVHTLKSC